MTKKLSKIHKLMELFWLVVAILTLIIAAYVMRDEGFKEGYQFLFPPLIAGVLYGIRRGYRKRLERES